jgi:hypothetical protein
MNELLEEGGDFTIAGSAWLGIRGFSIKIQEAEDSILIDVYKLGAEDQMPVRAYQVFDSETQDENL